MASETKESALERMAHGDYIKDVVFGANDGVITTFAVVAGVAGANLGASVILILGFANLIADGFSMAAGNYLGARSEQEFVRGERRRTDRLIASDPKTATSILSRLFRRKGFQGQLLAELVRTLLRNPKAASETILREELDLHEDDDGQPLRGANATFWSFVIAGALPLLPYAAGMVGNQGFIASIGMTAVALFLVGAARTSVTKEHWLLGGLEVLGIGAVAAVAAYGIGAWLAALGVGS